MYKVYSREEYGEAAERCGENVRNLLKGRLEALEERRDAINDRYPFEDLALQQALVDREEEILRDLLPAVDASVRRIRQEIDRYFSGEGEG